MSVYNVWSAILRDIFLKHLSNNLALAMLVVDNILCHAPHVCSVESDGSVIVKRVQFFFPPVVSSRKEMPRIYCSP